MRVLLRNCRTKMYYVGQSPHAGLNESGAGSWQALDFGNVRSAVKFTLEEDLPDMEIVLRYDSCDAEIALPVLHEWCLIDEVATLAGEQKGGARPPKANHEPSASQVHARRPGYVVGHRG